MYGGYDQTLFVCKVADRFTCQICTKVLREPRLAVCCGQHFCESCLNKWFDRQRGRESCPHCRSEGDAFNHVIDKGLRSEINELKIKCTHHEEGCEWRGELGALKTHLESQNGCGYEDVECPNKCELLPGCILVLKRKHLKIHLSHDCYLRPYQCEFCGHKDTYIGITGRVIAKLPDLGYFGHQATCPEVPLTCPNRCGSKDIKRNDMDSHRSRCPQERVECPFAEAGCTGCLVRSQLEDHMASSLQQHLMLVMKDSKETKRELQAKLAKAEEKLSDTEAKLRETEQRQDETLSKLLLVMKDSKETKRELQAKLAKAEEKLSDTEAKLRETEQRQDETLSKLSVAISHIFMSNSLVKNGDSVTFRMPNFSYYRCSGKLWHSPPFYYREGYKMCLAVYASGVGEGAGTHVSLSLFLLRGEYDDELQFPISLKSTWIHKYLYATELYGIGLLHVHLCNTNYQRPAINELQIHQECKFCPQEIDALKLVDNCFTLKISLFDECWIKIEIV